MNCRKFYYQLLGMTDNSENSKINYDTAVAVAKIRNLARKHHRMSENDCNGEGYVPGKGFYRLDGTSKNAYLPDGETSVFTDYSNKIEEKIKKLLPADFTVEFQGDPRGATVKLSWKNKNITEILWD